MPVTYTKDQRAYAKANKKMLATIGTERMMFQGPIDSEHVKLIEELLARIAKERSERSRKDASPSAQPEQKDGGGA